MYEEDELDETTEACIESIRGLLDRLPNRYMMTLNAERWNVAAKSIANIIKIVRQDEPDAEVSVDYDELIGTTLCLSIIANEFCVHDIGELCGAIKPSDTMSVIPRVDGKVEIGFTYRGVRDFVNPK